ncbi:WXG100 family type VII secretion target [Paenibacillus amylolyticus]|uniref:WXG100 family type VII secretion target n=1 Tax=Paenibacillus amylolyticus TaxID=1451 RepID=UPI003D97B076
MQRIQVHPDVLDEKARLVQQKKQELERMVWELEKSIYMLQSDWSGVTGERFFWDFMQAKEVFPTTLKRLNDIQEYFHNVAKNFRTTDGSGESVLRIPEELEPSFTVGLINKFIGETVTGMGQTAEAFFNNPFSTIGSVAYAMTVGKVVDVGRGIQFAWDTAWGTGTARSDIEQFVEEQKKQIDEDKSGYYKGAMLGQAFSYFLFGKALHSKDHNESGGAMEGKKEKSEGNSLNHDGRLRTEGTKTTYTNSFGNEISWTNQGPKDIDAIIEKNLRSSKPGDILEGRVAETIRETGRLEGTGIELKLQNKLKAGDIDILTESHIIEVKKSLSALDEKQLDKLINPSNKNYFNYDNREVIYYIEDVTVKNKTQSDLVEKLQDQNIKLICSLEELKEVISK